MNMIYNRIYIACIICILWSTLFCVPVFAQIPSSHYQRLDASLTGVKVLYDNTCAAFGEEGTLILSSDNGKTWHNTYLATDAKPKDIIGFSQSSHYFVCYGTKTLSHSTDKGNTWINTIVPFAVQQLFGTTDAVFSLTEEGSIMRSMNWGTTWTALQLPKNNGITAGMRHGKDSIIIITEQSSYYCSTDNGTTWSEEQYFSSLDTLPQLTYFYTHNNMSHLLFGNIVVRTQDWKTFLRDTLPVNPRSFVVEEPWVYYISQTDSIRAYSLTTKQTASFRPMFVGMPIFFNSSYNALAKLSDNSLVSVGLGKFIIKKQQESWELVSFIFQDKYSVHFYDDMRGIVGGANQSFCLTTNGGATWQVGPRKKEDSLLLRIVTNALPVYALEDSVFVVYFGNNIQPMISKDNGKTFTRRKAINGTSMDNRVTPISSDSFFQTGRGFLENDTSLVYLYTSGGDSLRLIKKIYARSSRVFARSAKEFIIFVSRNNLTLQDPPYFVEQGSYLLRTKDGGLTYDSTEIPSKRSTFTLYGYEESSHFFLTTPSRDESDFSTTYLYETRDDGKTFVFLDSTTADINRMWRDAATRQLFRQTRDNGIEISIDDGKTWQYYVKCSSKNTLFASKNGKELFLLNDSLSFVPVSLKRLYRVVPDSVHSFVTSVVNSEEEDKTIAYSAPVYLYSPYPNAFSSNVRFEIIWLSYAQPSETTLKVFNQMGVMVADISYLCQTLVSGNKRQTLEWSPDDLADGLYYIEARAGGYSSVRHLIKIIQ